MPTRETQNLIIRTAISLFNTHGTKVISTNRIASECHLSRGHLHYHFRTKEEIIRAIFQLIDCEMSDSWFEDHLHPTMEHMHFMFARQIKIMWQYRFFYRELNSLLQKNARLKVLFMENRRKRVKEVMWFFEKLVKAGLINRPTPPASLESIFQITWLITDQWLSYLDMHDRTVEESSIGEGYQLILQALQPCFTEKAKLQQQKFFMECKEADAMGVAK